MVLRKSGLVTKNFDFFRSGRLLEGMSAVGYLLRLFQMALADRRLGPGHKRQELPYGAAMPLGELQENMHLVESLPVAREIKT